MVASFWEGIFSACTGGMTNDYFAPYALALKATTRQIGLLAAAPFFASSIVQLESARVMERLKSHRKIIAIFVFLQLAMFIPIIFVPYLFKAKPVPFLIIFITLFVSLNTFVSPVLSNLMAKYVPRGMRGRYFGWRNKITTIILIISSLSAGLILHSFKKNVLTGFMVIFSIAFIARIFSWACLIRMQEPPFKIDKNSYFSLFDFVKNIRNSNFGRFALFFSGVQFCVNVASPFFSVFMLNDLKFSYITYTIIISIVTVIQILTIGRWGRCADMVGNVKVLRLTSLIIASLPLWWIISQNPFYLIFAQALSGFAWAGFNLCAGNFILDAVTPQKRIRCIAYFNILVGIGVSLGGLLGGQLAVFVPNIFGYKMLTLFLISSALRFFVVLSLSPKIQEVRPAKKMSTRELVSCVIGIKSIYKHARH